MSDAEIFDAETLVASSNRTQHTKIQGLDQIIAISEDSINSALQARFNSQLKRKADRRLRDFRHAVPGFGNITAILAAPKVRLFVPEAPESVRFFLNFSSGSFDYWSGFGPKAEPHTQDVSKWSIAFHTSFGLAKLANIPKDIADKITILRPGSYSVSQLLLGFSAARVAEVDWAASLCPGLDENAHLKSASQNFFKIYIDMYMKYLSSGPYSVLGYAIEVKNNPSSELPAPTKLLAPSFPPTKVRVRTQEYSPCTSEFNARFPKRAGLDAIIFEEMTSSHDGPREFPEVPYDPAKAGNWIAGDVSVSLSMSKRIFIEQFVLEKCALLNMQCIDVANDAFYWVRGRKGTQRNGNAWYLTKDPKPTAAQWTIAEDCAKYQWVAKNWTDNNTFFGGQWRDHLTTTFDNRLTWTAGSDVLKCTVSIKQNREEWNGGHGGEFSSDSLSSWDTSISWETTLRLGTIKAGELQVEVSSGTPLIEARHSSTQLAFDWGGNQRASYEQAAKDAMQNGINLDSIQNDLQNALNGQSSFVFPGGGDFFMQNAKFNAEGDLLIKLSYQSQAIAIDDNFHLQVSAPKFPEVDGQWLKVASTDTDDSAVVLVKEQKDATEFQVDDGDLAIDVNQEPAGSRSTTRGQVSAGTVRDLQFVTPTTFDQRKETGKIEFSVTGSNLAFALDSELKIWYDGFCMPNGAEAGVQLFTGMLNQAHTYPVFALTAVY